MKAQVNDKCSTEIRHEDEKQIIEKEKSTDGYTYEPNNQSITCFTIASPSIGTSSSLVILDISFTAHSVSKLNF